MFKIRDPDVFFLAKPFSASKDWRPFSLLKRRAIANGADGWLRADGDACIHRCMKPAIS